MSELSWEHTADEIETIIKGYVSDLGEKLDHISITWFESESSFLLELRPMPAAGIHPMVRDGLNWRLTPIAYISKYKDGDYCCDNFSQLREAGRRLYFQLRDKYPVKRDLSCN